MFIPARAIPIRLEYEEADDTFWVTEACPPGAAPQFERFACPALLVPALVGEYGDPHSLCDEVQLINLPAL